jgi:signal transduction histidine kinase
MRPTSDDSSHATPHRDSLASDFRLRSSAFGADETRNASLRLRSLAALSGSLTDALSPEDAAALIEQKALSALGATSAVVVTLTNFPPTPGPSAPAPHAAPLLTLVHAIGLRSEIRAELERLPLDAAVPLAEVARSGEPLFLHSAKELRHYPEWGATMIRVGARAAAIVPVWANGELRGVLGLTWKIPRTFDEDERAFVITLGVMCAQAILRSHLRAAEQRSREEAEHANRTKAHFLATISHELRTPINAVMGYTQLLSEEIYGPISPLQKDHLGRVRASGLHLLGLVEELLGYARIEAGEEVVRAEEVLLEDVVEQGFVLVRPLAEKKKLKLRIEGHDAPVQLLTDARKLRQILVNLLANAIKYTPSGDIVLEVSVRGAGEGARINFDVTDTGRGIRAENHEHVFDAFWQEDATTMPAEGSTGLGLSVARQLARLLGGDVTLARSSVASGSTFVLSLPVRYEARSRESA